MSDNFHVAIVAAAAAGDGDICDVGDEDGEGDDGGSGHGDHCKGNSECEDVDNDGW